MISSIFSPVRIAVAEVPSTVRHLSSAKPKHGLSHALAPRFAGVPIYVSSLGERTEKEPFDEEKTGWGWKLVAKIDTPQTMLPTTCKMDRP